ncbi:MAG: nucleotidyltransferase family protein [Pseudomonadota bacterium]|nr:nucleotidyltransferase family protein [Pseudomonadota bacterium]
MMDTEAGLHPKTAMVLAAGLGLRMRAITEKTPKPLVKVSGRSLLDHCLDRLADAGVEKAVVNIHYLGDQIRRHLQTRKDLEIIISEEPQLLDTGGGVLAARQHLGEKPFYVVNSDILLLDGPSKALGRLADSWRGEDMDAILLLHSTVEAYGYKGRGDFLIDPIGLLKRRPEREVAPFLFCGVQILHPRLFEDREVEAFSLNVLFDRAIAAERLYGIVNDGEWFHIGTPEGLSQAEGYLNQKFAGRRRR